MKRIIAVITLTVAMSCWWAVPAIAGCETGYAVKAPPHHANNSGNGNSYTQQRACVPNNQGTSNAANGNGNSQAITGVPCFR